MTSTTGSTVGSSSGGSDTATATGQGGAAATGSIDTTSVTSTSVGVGGATVSTEGGSSVTVSTSAGGTSTSSSGGAGGGSTGGGLGGAQNTTAAAGGTGSVAVHPDDAVEFGGHWYRFTQASIGGAEAEAICEGLGGYLACVESEGEDDFLFTLAGTARPWIGLNDEDEVSTWVWVNGSPLTYTNWQPGQPDYPDTERWVKIAEDGTWDDGNIPSSYICEWES